MRRGGTVGSGRVNDVLAASLLLPTVSVTDCTKQDECFC